MQRRFKLVLALLLVVIIVFFTFSFLDFRAATSETNVDSRIIADSCSPIGQQLEIDLASGLCVYVEGEDGLTEELRSRLAEKLRQEGIEVLEAGSLEEKYDHQALVVAIIDREVSYNPIYPSASLEILFVYSLSGNTTYFDAFKSGKHTAVHLSIGELLMEGRLNLTDSTKGIISHKAYQRHVAEEISNNIIQKLLSE
jgi:hypothetical protein